MLGLAAPAMKAAATIEGKMEEERVRRGKKSGGDSENGRGMNSLTVSETDIL